MTRNTFAIIVGVSAAGKSSLINTARDHMNRDIERLSYGSIFLKQAQDMGLVDNRDDITEINPEAYDELQHVVATEIGDRVDAATDNSVYVLDTHAVLDTPTGYRPGLPDEDVTVMDPDRIVQVHAPASTIHERRVEDTSRDRDIFPVGKIGELQTTGYHMAVNAATATRAQLSRIENRNGELETAAEQLVTILQ